MRRHYDYFAMYALKRYFTLPKDAHKTQAEQNNWEACNKVVSQMTVTDMALLQAILTQSDTLGDNVYRVAKDHDIDQAVLWMILRQAEEDFAKERGVI